MISLKKDIRYLYFSFYPIVFLASLFLYEISSNIDTLLYGFLICFISTLVYAVSYSGLLSLYSVYLYTSVFFLYNCFFLSLFTDKDFLYQTFPKSYSFEESIGVTFLICCFITVYVTHTVYVFKDKVKSIENSKYKYKKSRFFQTLGLIIFVIFLFPVVYKIYLQVNYIMKTGYASIYTGALSEIKYPIWTTGSFILFNTGYYILIASKPSKQEFIFYSIIYFLVYIADSLKGGRGNVLAILIIILVYYSKVYSMQIKLRKLIYVVLFILSFTITLGNLRNSYGSDEKTDNSTKMKFSELITSALWSQTNTRAVPMLIIKGDLKYHDYPFVFTPFTNLINSRLYPNQHGASRLVLEKFNNPSLVLISNVSISAGLAGFGYDSAFLGEAYECGGFFGIFFFSIIIGLLLAFFDFSKFNFSFLGTPLLFSILLTMPRLPRKPIFDFMNSFNLLIVIYIVIFAAYVVIESCKSNVEVYK